MRTLSNFKRPGLQFCTRVSVLSLCIFIASCANMRGPAYQLSKNDQETFSKPLRAQIERSEAANNQLEGVASSENSEPAYQVSSGPSLSISQQANVASDTVMPSLSNTKKIERLAFNNMPVGVFINEVFGNQLGLSFIVQPQVKQANDLVTMRLANPLSEQALYKVATQTLQSYGVSTALQDDILTFGFSPEASAGDTPLLISGRALPDVPPTNRPLFYVYPLQALSTPNVRSYLTQLFKRNELEVNEDSFSNSLILIGSKAKIEQAIAAIQLFDRPSMIEMHSRVITPSVSTARQLAANLESILASEGFSVRQGTTVSTGSAIRLLPLESSGQVILFAKSKEIANHVLNWVEKIEVKEQSEIEQGLFSYGVQSTLASHIVSILNNLGVANAVGIQNTPSNQDNIGNSDNTSSRQQNNLGNNRNNNGNNNDELLGRFTVDESLNTILFSGSGKQWLQILPIIKRLDKPAPSVMVEVILVEVQLNDNEETGVEWLANSSLGDFGLSFGTLGRLGIEGTGLGLGLVNSAGQTRAVINAFYENRRANIRSRPRIMVKSGGEASIDVGNEIPIVTSQAQAVTDGDAPIIATNGYRKTGVILDIKPTVHASGFVDIDIKQELSEAADNGGEGNPTILNRSLETTVTLRDGGSVLIGGLISSTTSEGQRGVPILGKLPLIGNLFRTNSNNQDRTELMVMIIPYILSSPDEAESLTDELQQSRLQFLEIE
ncbi:type II and III secretion system protein [Glaciecola siphonariae]|uniref:Type II and III secretion system protein n=1 Tax=Glaciecola siphonariae TaxID=521012 RepID=A0ABV9LU75_9ALTE